MSHKWGADPEADTRAAWEDEELQARHAEIVPDLDFLEKAWLKGACTKDEYEEERAAIVAWAGLKPAQVEACERVIHKMEVGVDE